MTAPPSACGVAQRSALLETKGRCFHPRPPSGAAKAAASPGRGARAGGSACARAPWGFSLSCRKCGSQCLRVNAMALVFLESLGLDDERQSIGRFLCDCGVVCIKRLARVRSGNTRSCGCLWLVGGEAALGLMGQSAGGHHADGLIAVIDREIRHLPRALALDPDSIEARRALTACERIRASLLLAMAQFQPRPRRPLGSPRYMRFLRK